MKCRCPKCEDEFRGERCPLCGSIGKPIEQTSVWFVATLLGMAAIYLAANWAWGPRFEPGEYQAILFTSLLGLAGVLIYFIPALVASSRRHPNTAAIFTLNIFLGWTFIGWVIALVWAMTAKAQA